MRETIKICQYDGDLTFTRKVPFLETRCKYPGSDVPNEAVTVPALITGCQIRVCRESGNCNRQKLIEREQLYVSPFRAW